MRALAVFTAVLVMTSVAFAQPADSLQEPSSLPGSITYSIDRAIESVSLAFTFSDKAEAEKRLDIAEKRLAEARELSDMNRSDDTEKVMKEYVEQMSKAEEITEDLPRDDRQEVRTRVNESAEIHAGVLKEVMEKIPVEARQGIETALESSGAPVRVPDLDKERPGDREVSGYIASGRVVPAGN